MRVPQKRLVSKQCDPNTTCTQRTSYEILRKMYGVTEKDGAAKERKIK